VVGGGEGCCWMMGVRCVSSKTGGRMIDVGGIALKASCGENLLKKKFIK